MIVLMIGSVFSNSAPAGIHSCPMPVRRMRRYRYDAMRLAKKTASDARKKTMPYQPNDRLLCSSPSAWVSVGVTTALMLCFTSLSGDVRTENYREPNSSELLQTKTDDA